MMKIIVKSLLVISGLLMFMHSKAMNNSENSSLEYLEKAVVGSHLIRNHIPGNSNLLSEVFKKYLGTPSLNTVFENSFMAIFGPDSSQIFSPDSSKIFGSSNGTAVIWCVRSQKILVTFQHDDPVATVIVSPDANVLFTCSTQNARLWEVITGKLIHVFHTISDYNNAFAFSPEGRKILIGCSVQGALLLDVTSGNLIHSFYHDERVNAVMFSPDGSKVLTGSADNFARLWDTNKGNLIHTFEYSGFQYSVFNPEGTMVLIISDDFAKLWDVTTGNLIHSFRHFDNYVNSVAFNFDGSQILTGSSDGTTKLWNTITGDCIHTFKHPNTIEVAGDYEEESEYDVWETTFSHDGTKILSRFGEYGALLWDTSSGNLIHEFDPTEFVEGFAISPDDTQILISSASKLKLWDIPDHRTLEQLFIILNLNQSDLLQAFELAIRERSRIHLKNDIAGNQIMETFRTLPLAIQRKLERFIVKEPNQNTRQSSSSSTTTGKRKYDENNL